MTESAWVIECSDRGRLTFWRPTPQGDWWADHHLAIRFTRCEDAQWVRERLVLALPKPESVRVCAHTWEAP